MPTTVDMAMICEVVKALFGNILMYTLKLQGLEWPALLGHTLSSATKHRPVFVWALLDSPRAPGRKLRFEKTRYKLYK